MLQKLIDLGTQTGGLLPSMGVLLVVMLAVIVERLWYFHRLHTSGQAMEHDLQRVENRDVGQLEKVAARYEGSLRCPIVSSALAAQEEGAATIERAVDIEIELLLPDLDTRLWVLEISIPLATLMGLAGTVIGIVHAFGNPGTTGGNGAAAPAVVAGLAWALVATGIGLLIAIFAVACLNYFGRRVRLVLDQMERIEAMVIGRLAPR
jgi:biopolymer transport protein ExbB/TolQ